MWPQKEEIQDKSGNDKYGSNFFFYFLHVEIKLAKKKRKMDGSLNMYCVFSAMCVWSVLKITTIWDLCQCGLSTQQEVLKKKKK